ncbi:Fungal transcriptional regulatory protein, N-terminal [Penicillium camemberti]|uniref:Fungal transcriptional regulatory protein, N-terminal n=1 Tax=Penicillium camemberti (strain FM 013) TaxID=1429867 RepID=A0A0G4PEB7_PENC3|nr:Fungal transcriptional regulatory protein, N-terminal [Penicillium camemberti]
MPRQPTPAAKQRVRTGCLTCRKRRRKCDEQKPSCANCEVKGLACRYSSDLAFVSQREGAVSGTSRQAYGSITFVDDSPLAAANKEKPKALQQPADDSQSDGNTGFSLDELQSSADGPDDTGDARRAFDFQNILSSTVPNVNLSEPLIPFNNERSAPNTRYVNSAPYSGYRSVARNRTVEQRVALANGSHETDLLRHFRYHVGPWIDTGDPELPFGLQVLLLSRTNRALQAAILALAAGQRLLVATPNTKDLESSQQFRKEAEESLALEYDLARYAGHTLLMLQDALPAGPQQWRSLLIPRIEHISDFASRAVGEEVGDALFWLYFRLDLAGSISSAKPPLMPFRSLLRRDGTLLHHTQSTRPQTVNSVYKHILCLLGHCLTLIHGDREMPSPHTITSPNLTAFPSLRQSHSLSQWTFLWSDCQKWYTERPVNVQQIVDIRGGEADQIDPDHDSSFPILIYTTPMALVANAAYHMISLLLLTHKPRLLKSLPGPRSVTSHIWHAQSIAGIAASNDSPEQWDPILVASLLTIAKEMTHESQQGVLLERFSRITATTGIKLDREIDALQAAWNLARYEEEFDDEADAMIS